MIKRIISAIFLIPIVILSIYFGDITLCFFLCIISILATNEFFKIAKINDTFTFICLNFFIVLYYTNTYVFINHNLKLNSNVNFEIAPISLLGIVFFILLYLIKNDITKNSLYNLSITIFSYIYLTLFLSFAIYIRNLKEGLFLLLMCITLIWITDTFAYFGGILFGKNSKKLSPIISPKKTYIGVYFGLFFSLLSSILFFKFSPIQVPMWLFIVYAFIINIFSVLGDLVESKIKREFEIKDSSNLIPGHGGILDRIDSLILNLPISYYYFIITLKNKL